MSLKNIYWVIHYFVEGDQNDNFHLRFGDKLQDGENIIYIYIYKKRWTKIFATLDEFWLIKNLLITLSWVFGNDLFLIFMQCGRCPKIPDKKSKTLNSRSLENYNSRIHSEDSKLDLHKPISLTCVFNSCYPATSQFFSLFPLNMK